MKYLILLFVLVAFCNLSEDQNADRIKPWQENQRYWQYKGQPVLLLGASDDDNLFLLPNLEAHLDLLASTGGNFIRNTMSSRDEGNPWPFYQRPDGKYDLEQWNTTYWEKFDSLLQLTSERDIFVQIEVWDRFDFSREPWLLNPFNPANNINYTTEQSGLETAYLKHPQANEQPFFYAIRGMEKYDPKLEIVRNYQEKFVDKLLSYSLDYGNILYCMNNETHTPPAWGKYWMHYIEEKAGAQEVFTTDMFDGFYRPHRCPSCLDVIKNPAVYEFLDISQINSRNFGQNHWDTLTWIMAQREAHQLRPVNCTKVYGGGESSWGSGTNEDGVERFFRDVIGGCAAVRHHRPPSGNGLNEKAQNSIKTIRKIETLVKFWEIKPNMALLSDREENEAYVSAKDGDTYVLYFPKGGKVKLDLAQHNQTFDTQWLSVETANWEKEQQIKGGHTIDLETPDEHGWFVVLKGSAQ